MPDIKAIKIQLFSTALKLYWFEYRCPETVRPCLQSHTAMQLDYSLMNSVSLVSRTNEGQCKVPELGCEGLAG